MAYTFQKIANALEDPEKKDIFQQTVDQPEGISVDSAAKTEQTGIEQSQATSQPSAGAKAPEVKTDTAGNQALFQAAQKRGTAAPVKALNKAREELSGEQRKLSEAGQAYLSRAKRVSPVNQDTIQAALRGAPGGQEFEKVRSLLQEAPPAQEAFVAPEIELPDVGQFQTEAGTARALQSTGTSSYTPGMAALDAAILSRDPTYQAAAKGLARQQDTLLDNASALGAEVQNKAAQQYEQELAGAQQQAKNALMARYRDLRSDLGAKEREEEIARAELAANPQSLYKQLYGKALAGVDPEDIARLESVRPISDYVEFAPTDVSPSAFMSPEQANTFNNIMSLLGMEGAAVSPTELGARYSFDPEAYKQQILDDIAALPPAPEVAPPVTEPEVTSPEEPGVLPDELPTVGQLAIDTSLAGDQALPPEVISQQQPTPSYPEEPGVLPDELPTVGQLAIGTSLAGDQALPPWLVASPIGQPKPPTPKPDFEQPYIGYL